MTTDDILYIMPIHGHCTLMYPGLESQVEIDYCIVLMSGWIFHLGLHYYTSGMDYIMYFNHHVTPLTSHIREHLLYLILPHLVDHIFMAFHIPLQTL